MDQSHTGLWFWSKVNEDVSGYGDRIGLPDET